MIRILSDALTSPAKLVERFGAAGMPSDQVGNGFPDPRLFVCLLFRRR
jgi:hypothetical protein